MDCSSTIANGSFRGDFLATPAMRGVGNPVTPIEALSRIFLPSSELPPTAKPRYICLHRPAFPPRRSFTSANPRLQTSAPVEEDAWARILREREEKRNRQNAEKKARKQQALAQAEARKAERAAARPRSKSAGAADDDGPETPTPPPPVALRYRVPAGPHPPIDEEIRSYRVRVRDPVDGTLREPVRLHDALAALNRQRYFLAQANVADPGLALAVCRIVEKTKMYDEVRARQERDNERAPETRESKGTPKSVQIHWGEERGSLDMKVRRVVGFLREGRKVVVDLCVKKRSRREIPMADLQRVVKEVKDAVGTVPRAKESRPMTGMLGKAVMLYFEVD